MTILSPLQQEGFRIFANRPNGVRYSELGKYKMTTIGSMWRHGWIHYLPGRDAVVLSNSGSDAFEEWKEYLAVLTLERSHPSDRLSVWIDVTSKQRRTTEIGQSKASRVAAGARAKAGNDASSRSRSAKGGLGYRGGAGNRMAAAG